MSIEDCFNIFIFDTDDVDVDSEASPNLSTGIKFTVICFCLFWDLSVTSTGDGFFLFINIHMRINCFTPLPATEKVL